MNHLLNDRCISLTLLVVGLAVAAPTAASAHFVWAEPAPASEGVVHVYFGEYPTVREASPLLDKVQGVKLYALGAGPRRELKQLKGTDHFRYEGAGAAPVIAGTLDYGVLEREGTPPFMLRYETLVLRGGGGPQSLQNLAKLSRVETGLALAVTLEPSATKGADVRVTLGGKPVTAEISSRGPNDADMVVTKTSADGRATLALTMPGWQHLRIKAEDGKPITVSGKEVKFSRTYLSLMFNVAAAPTTMQSASAKPVAVQADAGAVAVLREAHEARANWKAGFPGFTADAVYRLNGKEARGTITVKSDFSIEYALGDKELETALRPSFASLIMHRRGGGEAPNYQGTWRDTQPHLLGRAINLNDELGSFYRIRDRQIMEVNRVMGSQRFTNTVLENEATKLGFLPRAWSVAYYDRETSKLLRTSTTQVSWTWIGDVFLPATLQTVNAHDAGTDVSRLELTNHRLAK
jgi:hypothetical protein